MNCKRYLILLFLFSCKQTETILRESVRHQFTLEFGGTEEFILDSASFVRTDLEFHEIDGSEYLILYNGHAFKQVDIYDFRTHRIHKKISLQQDGPNGIGATPSGLFVQSLDSIFLFFNRGQRLLLIDGDGRPIRKFGEIRNRANVQNAPYIEVSSRQPTFRRGADLIFCTYDFENKNETAGAIFNLDEETTTFPFSLPDIYSDGWWAGVVYDRYYHTYNKESDLIVQSFGNDNNVYVVDSHGQRRAYSAKSNYLPDEIKPYSKTKGDYMRDEQFLYRHAALQGGYSTIKYDPWQKVYYRYVIRPVPSSEYHSPSQTWSNMAILILDENFNNLGEFDVPKDYSWHQSFVSKRGLSFFDKKAYSESEDSMVFANFKLRRIEK